MSQSVSDCLSQEQVEEYLRNVQRLLILGHEKDSQILDDVTQYIESWTDQSASDLFKAELAFHKGRYRVALQHYLSEHDVPFARFFCYRCSAMVAQEMGRTQKALSLARQALELRPHDYTTLRLLDDMSAPGTNSEESALVRERLHSLIESARETGEAETEDIQEPEPTEPVGLAEQEFKELTNLFQEETDPMHEDPQAGASGLLVEDTAPEAITTNEMRAINLDDVEETATPAVTMSSSSLSAADELNRLVESSYATDTPSTSELLSGGLGLNLDSGLSLEERIRQFQRRQVDDLSLYIQRATQRPQLNDNHFYMLHGWAKQDQKQQTLTHSLLPNRYQKTTGGYFLRWNGKGVVINPGTDFLENFHSSGFHVKDIDYVIVTNDSRQAHADIQAIYDLNYRVNKMDSTLHIINYYLNQQAHRQLASSLKPHFKQERNTVHSMELYVDSPDVERMQLGEGITLEYFPTFSPENESKDSLTTVGIRLQLETMTNGRVHQLRIGYLSGAAYSPVMAHHLSNTDVLIAAFGDTDANDYGKIAYNDDSLGFFGTHSLIEEIAPKLVITSEFSGKDGDVRVEVAKKLRQETTYQSHSPSVVLPGDYGLTLDLETQRVLCSVSNAYVEPTQLQIVKTTEAFGRLNYLSPSCLV